MKIALGISAVCVLVACSDASNVASSSAALDQVVLGDFVMAHGCTFTVATGVESSSLPPVYVAFVRVTGNQHQCPHDDVVLGTSFALPVVAIASGRGRVVADWTSKATPSGEAHTQLFIAEVSVGGTIGKETELAAMSPDLLHPQLGNVRSGALDVHGHSLVVTGDKDGVIPDEIGSGDHYVATYARFFDSKSTTPTIVIAY